MQCSSTSCNGKFFIPLRSSPQTETIDRQSIRYVYGGIYEYAHYVQQQLPTYMIVYTLLSSVYISYIPPCLLIHYALRHITMYVRNFHQPYFVTIVYILFVNLPVFTVIFALLKNKVNCYKTIRTHRHLSINNNVVCIFMFLLDLLSRLPLKESCK